jgi:phosphoserine aminotransferase
VQSILRLNPRAVPESYAIFFMQGGGTTQFSAVPMNLFSSPTNGLSAPIPDNEETAYYIQTGSWSSKAVVEAKKIGVLL